MWEQVVGRKPSVALDKNTQIHAERFVPPFLITWTEYFIPVWLPDSHPQKLGVDPDQWPRPTSLLHHTINRILKKKKKILIFFKEHSCQNLKGIGRLALSSFWRGNRTSWNLSRTSFGFGWTTWACRQTESWVHKVGGLVQLVRYAELVMAVPVGFQSQCVTLSAWLILSQSWWRTTVLQGLHFS